MRVSIPARRRLAALAGVGTALGFCAGVGHGKTPKPAAPPAVVAANTGVKRVAAADTDFGLRLLKRLVRQQPKGNVFFSPLSVSSALAMTWNGASGQTQRDMARTLGLSGLSLNQVNTGNGLLIPSLTQPDPKVKVSVANALWTAQGITLAPSFTLRCRQSYGAQLASLDMASPGAVTTINDWVNRNTQGKITRLVSHGDIAESKVVLTNAVYFHGKWQTPFEKNETRNGPFHLGGGATKTVPLMNQRDSFSYRETPQYQAVSLPYGNRRICLDVVLPKPGQNVEAVAGHLDAATWKKQIAAMTPKRLDLTLQRFHADTSMSLRTPLSALGMASAFGGGADFRPMGLSGGFIGDVIHKAVLAVDEEGTTAAAVTGVMMPTAAAPQPTTVMRVDRPFFLAIRDTATGTLLFAGVIRDPK